MRSSQWPDWLGVAIDDDRLAGRRRALDGLAGACEEIGRGPSGASDQSYLAHHRRLIALSGPPRVVAHPSNPAIGPTQGRQAEMFGGSGK